MLRQYQTVLVTCWRCFLYEVKFALYLQTHNVSYLFAHWLHWYWSSWCWRGGNGGKRRQEWAASPPLIETTTVYHPAVRCTFLWTCTRAWMNKKLDEKKTKRDSKGLMFLGIYAAWILILSKLDIMWSNQKTPREGRWEKERQKEGKEQQENQPQDQIKDHR